MMDKILFAIKSCQRDQFRGDHEIIRQTWGSDLLKSYLLNDLRFFVGGGGIESNNFADDEVCLDCDDDYDSLPFKTKAIAQWGVNHNYEFIFFCDTDTFIIPSQLMRCGFENYDIAGRFGSMPALGTTFNYKDARGSYPNCHPWPSGGVGYFISRKAAEIIVKTPPTVWAEDMYVGQVLGPHIQSGNIKALDIPNFECNIAWHFPRKMYGNQSYDPKYGWMEKMYKEYR